MRSVSSQHDASVFSDLAIQVRTNSLQQPVAFQMDGRNHVVDRVIKQWEVDTDWWHAEGRAWRRQYAVITREENLFCVLSRDLLAGTWQLEKIYD